MGKLYSDKEIENLKKRKNALSVAFWTVCALTLAGCVFCCVNADPGNALMMEHCSVIISIAGGWIAIYVRIFMISDTVLEMGHACMLTKGEPEIISGKISVDKTEMRIRRSIPFRNVTCGDKKVCVIENKAGLIEAFDGKDVKLEIVKGYISGYEIL